LKDELNEMNEDMMFSKGCFHRMAQKLVGCRETELAKQAFTTLEQANKASY
jgi:hypothetical protein